jgi:hypothetical protein
MFTFTYRRCFNCGLSLLALLLTAFAARAQAPAWQQALAGTAQPLGGIVVAQGNAADAGGNVYVAGYFTGRVAFGSTVVTSAGLQDVFVAKWVATTGAWAWVQTSGGTRDDSALGVAVSGSSIYVTGFYAAPAVSFGSTVLTSAGGTDVFAAKITDLGSSASWAWALGGGSAGDDQPAGIAASGSNVYVAGYFTEYQARFGPATLTNSSSSSSDIFVARLSDGGSTAGWSWAQSAGGLYSETVAGLAVSGSSVYVAGSFITTTTSPLIRFGTRTVTSAGGKDAFLAKLTDTGSAGSWGWATSQGGTLDDFAYTVAASGSSVYLGGGFQSSTIRFGTAILANGGREEGYVAKLTDTGSAPTWSWAQRATGTADDEVHALAPGPGGSLYVGGRFDSPSTLIGGTTLTNAGGLDQFVGRLSDAGSTSSWDWVLGGGGSATDLVTGLAAGGSQVYVTGAFLSPAASYGSALNSPLTPGGMQTSMVGSLSDTGTWQAVQVASAGGISVAVGSTALPAGNAYVTGYFNGQVYFGSTRLTSKGGLDVFVAKWDAATASWAWAISGGGPGDDRGIDVALAPDGLIIAGSMSAPTADFGATTLTGAGGTDAFVAKISEAPGYPVWTWATRGGGSNSDGAGSVAVSGTSIYFTGSYVGPATFGVSTLPSDTFGNDNIVVARLTDNGSSVRWNWASSAGGTGDDYGSRVVAEGSSVYVCGVYARPSATFGSTTLSNTGTLDGYVAKLTDAGNAGTWAWVQGISSANIDEVNGLAVSGTTLYLGGNTEGPSTRFGPTLTTTTTGGADVFVAKLSVAGPTPTWTWLARTSSISTERLSRLALSGSSLYLTGIYFDTPTFGSTTLPNAGVQDMYVAKLQDGGSTASWAWATSAGGPVYDYSGSIAVGGRTVYMCGALQQDATFGALTLPTQSTVAFLASLTDPALPLAATPAAALAAQPLVVAPNPAHGTTTLTLVAGPAPRPLLLLDALGRAVRRQAVPAQATSVPLDLLGLAPGVYTLRLGAAASRLVVE